MDKVIKEIVDELKKDEEVLAILLFGSKGKMYERRTSDIDICVVAPRGGAKLFEKTLRLMKDERIDIKLFEDLPLFIKIKVIETGKVLYVKDKVKLFEYFYLIRKIWEDENLAISKLSIKR